MKNKIERQKIARQILDIIIFVCVILVAIPFVILNVLIVGSFISHGKIIFLESPSNLIIIYSTTFILMIIPIAYLIYRKKNKRRNPNLLLEEAIEATDERGIIIMNRAESMAIKVTTVLLLAVSIVMKLLGYSMIFYITFGIVCVNVIFVFAFWAYYKKKT